MDGGSHTEPGTFALSGYAAADQGGAGDIEARQDRLPFDIALSGDGGTITLGGQTLVVRTGGATYRLARQPAGCISVEVDGVRSYLTAWVSRERPGARTLDLRDRPDLAAPYANLQVDDPATGLPIWVEAGEIVYAFEHGGLTVEERLAAVVITMESRGPTVDSSMSGFPTRTALGHVVRAPAGQLGPFAVLADTVLRLVRVDPQWQAAIDEHHRRIADDNDNMGSAAAAIHQRRAHRAVPRLGRRWPIDRARAVT